MTLNLDKNKSVLVHAYKEVLDERNPINWALFGYDGQTYDLTLVSKGDGDLEEMIEDFNSGKIQYALCRVKIKEKNVEKIVLINWQGEGAPLARKGMCANHLGTIKNFFKGVHITLNARTDEDVEPDLILQMVSKAVAGEGVKISSVIEPDAPPVGAVYKRTNPQEEINSKAKDDFWRKEEQEEERRKREESNRHRKFSVDEVKLLRKESQDYFDKEEQEVALLKNSIANAKQQKSPSPQPPPYNFNGNSNGINGNSNGFNKPAHAHSNSNSSSSSPIPPNERAAITAAALSASTPMKNSNNSDLVRQRIKSFDGGSTGPVFPIKNNSQTKINGNSSASNSPVNFNGSSSPASSLKVNSVGSTGIKSPTGITGSKSPTGNGTGNGDNSGESEKSLSVRNRKILFESGGASNTVGSSTIGRKNPAEEIRQAQAQEELKKKQEQEKEKAKPEVVKPEPEEPKLISPTAHFQSSIISKSIPAQLPEKVPEVIQPPPSFNDKVPDVVAEVSKAKEIEIPPPTFFANSPLPKSPSPQPTAHVQAPSTIINKAAAMADYDDEIFEDTSVRSAQNSFVRETNTKGQSSPRPASVSPLPVNGNSHGVNGDEDLNGGETITIEITPDMGICARALYDYQAADETEITFDPGDIIRNIEKIDEGWWEGLGPADQYGLFPANYVELLN